MPDYLVSMLTVFAVFIFILFMAYYTTRLVAKKAGRMMQGKYIKVIDTISLGSDKKLHLVKVEEKFFVIATFGKNVEYMTEVDIDNYSTEMEENTNDSLDFKVMMKDVMSRFRSRSSERKNDNYKKDRFKNNQDN